MKTRVEIFCSSKVRSLLLPALTFAACLLGGCTSLEPVTPTVAVVAAEAVKTELSPLEYYAWAIAAPESELQIELYGLDLAISATDPVIVAVRKSIILGSSAVAATKTQLQAASLLAEITTLDAVGDNSRAYKTFGEVLLSIQQQREDLRAASDLNQRALREIDTLKGRNRELQQQIEELTSIERQIIERERLNTVNP